MSSDPTLPIDALAEDAVLGACSQGILDIPHLAAFFGGRRVQPLGRAPVAGVVGWGNKRSGLTARAQAHQRGVPLAILEDGFIRSIGLAKLGAPPVSLVVDDIGIYYDARSPSRLERLLADTAWITPDVLRAAQSGLARWSEERLTKYNTGTDQAAPDASPRILLVDQVQGDASIAGALASAQSFARMLDDALAANLAAHLAVRSHPDVTAGKARGYLTERARRAGIAVLDADLSTHAALDRAAEVWTVSSAMGFEAILRGIPVRTYGVPFYAGFGCSDDRAADADAAFARRGIPRTPIDLFAAAMLRYARYADPVTRKAISFDQAVDRLIDWRRHVGELTGGRTTAFGFSRWKRASASVMLGGGAVPVTFAGKARTRSVAAAVASGAQRLAVWGTTEAPGFAAAAAEAGVPLVRVEDGFIRSVGLGSDLRPAGSLVVDDLGVYFDARTPSRLEALIQTHTFAPDLIARAQALRARLVASATTKYNLGPSTFDMAALAAPATDRRQVVLIAEQVPGDASLRYGGGAIATNLDLLRAVRAARPSARIIYKEHPDLVAGNRKGRLHTVHTLEFADHVVSDGDIASFFGRVDEVHVISSLAGFEALCRGTRVVVWGKPFYAGWGLTDDREAIPRRLRRPTLDELVAATLILYPCYIDPVSGVPCAVEEYLDVLDGLRAAGPVPRQTLMQRQIGRLVRWTRSFTT